MLGDQMKSCNKQSIIINAYQNRAFFSFKGSLKVTSNPLLFDVAMKPKCIPGILHVF